MLFQEEAQAFMGIDKQQPANAEFAKMARGGLSRSLGVEYDRRYDTAGAFLTSSKRPPVASISEARMVLRSAAVRRDDAGAPQRIQQALSYVSSLPVKERIPSAKVMAVAGSGGGDGAEKPPTPEAATTGLLRGEWLLGLTVTGSGKAIAFAPPEASLTVTPSSGSYEKLAPAGIGLVKTSGSFVVESGKVTKEVSLRLEVDSCSFGALPLPTFGKGSTERIVFIDSLMCVTSAGGGNEFTVYVRPSMRNREDDDDDV